MKRIVFMLCLFFLANTAFSQDQKINVIVFGAHPDDCDNDTGGTALLFAQLGHNVKFVSLTNGDAGHYAMAAHESQFFDWLPWTSGKLDMVPEDEKSRLEFLAQWRTNTPNEATVKTLKKWYGDQAIGVKHAEGFEICEYGKQPSDEEIKKLFPMLGKE